MTDLQAPPEDTPIVCTIRPGDEEEAGMALYRTLFADAYLRGERTASGVRWTFRDDDGVEARVRALAGLERRCCAFLRTAVSVSGGEVRWDVVGPSAAQQFLDEYFRLPQTIGDDAHIMLERAAAAGLAFDDQR